MQGLDPIPRVKGQQCRSECRSVRDRKLAGRVGLLKHGLSTNPTGPPRVVDQARDLTVDWSVCTKVALSRYTGEAVNPIDTNKYCP